jgi:hypothetical protein
MCIGEKTYFEQNWYRKSNILYMQHTFFFVHLMVLEIINEEQGCPLFFKGPQPLLWVGLCAARVKNDNKWREEGSARAAEPGPAPLLKGIVSVPRWSGCVCVRVCVKYLQMWQWAA